jgi:hypothetical protein
MNHDDQLINATFEYVNLPDEELLDIDAKFK